MRRFVLGIMMALILGAGPVLAEPSAEIKAGTGIREREIVDAASSFPTGTTVYVWTAVSGMSAGSTIKHVWKRDGVQFNVASLDVTSDTPRWRTWSRHPGLKTGAYTVEVTTGDDTPLGTVSFTVK